MAFKGVGGRRVGGRVLDQFDNELGQMVDEVAPLLSGELLADLWDRIRFCAPQFLLLSLHVGSPGLGRFGLWSDRLRAGVANIKHAGAGVKSPMRTPLWNRKR